jgi:diketogulonate reductase-like aldo/keto reductase
MQRRALSSASNALRLDSTATLNSGYAMPRVGLGTWRSQPGQVTAAVKAALGCGYKHIDTAWIYQNEKEVGEGINQSIEAGSVTRDGIFVTTKLWNQFHQPEHVENALKDSLSRLRLDYVDLYLVHWPIAFKQGTNDVVDVPLRNTWEAMEPLVEKGLVRSIGISNYSVQQMEDLLKYCKVKPVTNQCEAHPHFPNSEVAQFCKENGMVFTAYSSLGNVSAEQESCLTDPLVVKLAQRYGKTPAQILLRWGLQRDYMILPKSVSVQRVADNANLFDFEISDQDMADLTNLGQGKTRKLKPTWAKHF